MFSDRRAHRPGTRQISSTMTPRPISHPFLRRLYHLTAVIALAAGATRAGATLQPESSHGPDPSYTGAPAIADKPAEFNCTLCHFSFTGDNLNTPGGSVQIIGLPAAYQPGQLYPLQVRLDTDSTASFPNRRWGFQLTAIREQDGEGCGSFVLPPGDSLQVITGWATEFMSRNYVEHQTLAIHPGASGPMFWSFSWQAPAAIEGTVRFCAAGNAVDGSEDPGGDFVFTTQALVNPAPVAIEPVALPLMLEAPFPNPSGERVRFRFSLPRATDVRLELFDAGGRRIRTLVHGALGAGAHETSWRGETDRGTAARPGLYWARLVTPLGERRTRIVRDR